MVKEINSFELCKHLNKLGDDSVRKDLDTLCIDRHMRTYKALSYGGQRAYHNLPPAITKKMDKFMPVGGIIKRSFSTVRNLYLGANLLINGLRFLK